MADGESEQAPEPLTERLRLLHGELRRRGVSQESSAHYCQRFCELLIQYGEKYKATEELLPLMEVYRISIQSYTSARPYLTTECAHINFLLGQLAVSCFELLLSLPDNKVPQDVWQQLQQTLQDSHSALLEFGNNELQPLLTISREGGAWKNSVLQCILSKQTAPIEEVNNYLMQEGPTFLEIRIKHLMKTERKFEAALLAKCCAENAEFNSKGAFRQIYLTCLCTMGPNEEAAKEIARVDCKEVLDIICNLESDGQDSAAFVLCTTFLTHQLQQESVYCSWELTLFWSKLQRRMDPSLDSFLERCRQLGIIARTVYHIFFLIKVIQSEAEGAGLPISIELCVGALRIQSNENAEMKISICKTIACLMPDDLEVRRACQLTQFLLEPTVDAYREVERLYKQPDQKYDEENGPIPNSLHCELLLVLKAHWPFDPEFWDWKTLKRHCRGHLGEKAVAISEDELSEDEADGSNELFDQMSKIPETIKNEREKDGEVVKKKEKVMSERYYRWLQNMFFCVLCKKDYVVARMVHHAKTHVRDGIFSCPVCAKKFKRKEQFTPHVKEHIKKPKREKKQKKKSEAAEKPLPLASSMNAPTKPQARLDDARNSVKKEIEENDYIIFSGADSVDEEQGDVPKPEVSEVVVTHWTESYPCPGTACSRSFKYYKNLTAHLKNDHLDNDENVKHFLEMNNRKALCKYCRRHFVSNYHLKAHLKVHSGLQPYICIQMNCNASFQAFADLVKHRKQHKEFRSKCTFKGCNKVFSGSCLLYHHEAQHYREAAYSCNLSGCKKFYFSKSEFQSHLLTHGLSSLEEFEARVLKKGGSTEGVVDVGSKLVTAEEKQCHVVGSGAETVHEKVRESAENPSQSCSYSVPQEVKKEKEEYNPGGSYCATSLGADRTDSANKGKPEYPNLQGVYSENLLVPLEKLASFKELSDIEDMMKAATLHPELNRTLAKHKITPNGADSLPTVNQHSCGIDGCIMMYASTKDLKKHIKVAHPNYYKAKKRIDKHSRSVVKVSATDQDKVKAEVEQQPLTAQLLPSQGQEGQSAASADELCENKNVSLKAQRVKKPKNNRNAKWPAIFKDGKFVCSRCFKEFSNPKSLGGHLARKIKCPLLTESSSGTNPIKKRYEGRPPGRPAHVSEVPTLEDVVRALQKLQLNKSEAVPNEVMVCSSTLSSSLIEPLPPPPISAADASMSKPLANASQSQTRSRELFQTDPSKEDPGVIKPFVCDYEGCAFKAMTKDGLINHYVKTHKYSKDKVLQLSRFQLRFAPFKCHICLRTFTRKTNLRTHYKQMHRFSKEDMQKGKFPYINCVSVPSNTTPQLAVPNILIKTENDSPRLTEEKLCSSQNVTERLSLSQDTAPIKIEKGSLYPVTVPYQTKDFNLFGDDEHAQLGTVSGSWRQTGSDSENTMNESFTTEVECSESAESLKSEEMHLNGSMESSCMMPDSADDSESKEEGRGSRRIGTKSNLCYMLNKYHKPYHCIHKGCSAAFTGQPNLIRHYQTVHQYNREQMCLEEDQGNAKKDNTKVKKIFKCKFEGCTKRFQYPRVLLRHYSEIHKLAGGETAKYPCNQPDCMSSFNMYGNLRRQPADLQFKCSIDGCSRTYTIRSSYLRHVQRQHKAHYKSILLKPRKNSNYDRKLNLERCNQDCFIDGEANGSASADKPGLRLIKQERLTDEDSCGSALPHAPNLGRISGEHLSDEGGCDSESEAEPSFENYKDLDPYGSALKAESNLEGRSHGDIKSEACSRKAKLEPDIKRSLSDNHSDDSNDSSPQDEDCERNASSMAYSGSSVDEYDKEGRKSGRCRDYSLKSTDHGFAMCKNEVLRDQFPCMVDDCQTVVLSRRSVLRHYKILHKMTAKYIEQNCNTLLVCKKYSDTSREKVGSDSPAPPKKVFSEQVEDAPGCSVLRQQNGEVPLKTEFKIEPDDVGSGLQLQNCGVTNGNDAFPGGGNVLFPGKSVNSSLALGMANRGPSFKENDANRAFLPKNGGVIPNIVKQSGTQNGSLFPKLKQPLKRKFEMDGQSQRTDSTYLPQGSLFGTKESQQSQNAQQKPFDLTTYKPIGFEASFLKFIQESEDTENDVEESWHWDPPKRCKKFASHQRESGVNTGSNESTVENCTGCNADCDKSDSTVHNSFAAIEPLISQGSTPSLENLRTILDKALTDCGDLALKQLHFLRPVVVLERSEFSTPLLELFPTKKNDELCVGSS